MEKFTSKSNIRSVLTLLFLVGVSLALQLGLFSNKFMLDLELRKSKDGYIIVDIPENRKAFDWCSATDNYLYFSYSGELGGVDVYDETGAFLCWIYFEDIEKGSIRLCNVDNLLYVQLRNNTVYIFDGITLVERLSEADAINSGFNATWFKSQPPNLEVTEDHVYKLNQDGSRMSQINRPVYVHSGPSASNLQKASYVEILCTISIMLLGFGFITFKWIKD